MVTQILDEASLWENPDQCGLNRRLSHAGA